jgi:hypothetical protein
MINAVGWLMCWQCTVKDSSSVLKLDPVLDQSLSCFRTGQRPYAPVFEQKGKLMYKGILIRSIEVSCLVANYLFRFKLDIEIQTASHLLS